MTVLTQEFILGVRFLRGCVVATETFDRDGVEWPLHPGRLFMAMVSAWGETGSDPGEKKILEWIESLEPPEVICGTEFVRTPPVTVFVPGNDRTVKAAARNPFNGLPSIYKKSDRTFPIADLQSDTLFFRWSEVLENCPDSTTLEMLCEKVSRIGHSSSLVQVWVSNSEDVSSKLESDKLKTWMPTDSGTEKLRLPKTGTVESLENSYYQNREPSVDFIQGYSEQGSAEQQPEPDTSFFSPDLLVLSKLEGSSLGLESTFQLSSAIRALLMSKCPNPIPEWLSGHQPESTRSENPHLAIVPLAFVGGNYGDGHVMGMGLVFPRSESSEIFRIDDLNKAIGPVFFDESGTEQESIKLFPKQETLDCKPWEWEIQREAGTPDAKTLQSDTWTKPSRSWASATPVVLPKFPKKNRKTNRVAWENEVCEIISIACMHSGLPRPKHVRISQISSLSGVPSCRNFPTLPQRSSRKGGQSCRIQTHAELLFENEVEGPVLIGSGRYFGYGFFKPTFRKQKGTDSNE